MGLASHYYFSYKTLFDDEKIDRVTAHGSSAKWIVIAFGTPILIVLESNRNPSRSVISGAKICVHVRCPRIVRINAVSNCLLWAPRAFCLVLNILSLYKLCEKHAARV